ncbi:hypothetical protein PVK06_000247 [Gossypium arboreum]|uniref:Uncharacterized protein n=1 Tax=Gossypium arboreum TaxID=29729 RepID=A0ABR0QYW1_GOSAR|nr:hypothetical protein PVK06_000247 [Gossypium arboreum]
MEEGRMGDPARLTKQSEARENPRARDHQHRLQALTVEEPRTKRPSDQSAMSSHQRNTGAKTPPNLRNSLR